MNTRKNSIPPQHFVPFPYLCTPLSDPCKCTILGRKTFNISVEWKDLSAYINQLIFQEIQTVLPIPPGQQLINFIPLIMVIQEIQDSVVEMLRIGDMIHTRENLSRSEGKLDLYL